jgi:hypothetical protein
MYTSKYGVARHVRIPIIKAGTTDFAVGADWTPVAGDITISKDGGAAANVTNLPTAIVMGNGAIWDFSLTATEMQAAQMVIAVVDAVAKEVQDSSFTVETFGNASAQYAFDLSVATQTVNAATLAAGSILQATFATGAIDSNAVNADIAMTPAILRSSVGLAAANLDTQFITIPAAVWSYIVDGTRTSLQLMRGFAAVLMGRANGLNTALARYRNIDDTKNVVSATCDQFGDRSSVTLDLS